MKLKFPPTNIGAKSQGPQFAGPKSTTGTSNPFAQLSSGQQQKNPFAGIGNSAFNQKQPAVIPGGFQAQTFAGAGQAGSRLQIFG